MKFILYTLFVLSNAVVGFEVKLLDYVKKNGTICSSLSCLSFYHIVFTTYNLDQSPPPRLRGLTRINNIWSDGLVYENHLVSGDCSDSSDPNSCENYTTLAAVYSFGYTAVSPSVSEAPELFCVRLQLSEIQNSTSRKSLDLGCSELSLINDSSSSVIDTNNTPHNQFNTFSSAVTWLNGILSAHLVFSVAPPSPMNQLAGVIEYSLDCGKSWYSVASRAFFESHIDIQNSTYFQSWQADLELLLDAAPTVFCFKISLVDILGPPQEPTFLVTPDFSPVPNARCLTVTQTPVPFHWPLGYCPNCTDPSTLCSTVMIMIILA